MMSSCCSRTIALLRLVGLVGALAATLVVLHWLGSDPRLAGPSLAAPTTWSAWARGQATLDAVFSVVRLLLVAADVALLASIAGAVAAQALGAARAVAILDHLTLPFVRRMVDAAVGWGLVATTLAVPGAAFAAVPPAAVVAGGGEMRAPVPPGGLAVTPDHSDVPMLRRVSPDEPTQAVEPRPPATPRPPAVPRPSARSRPPTEDRATVESRESRADAREWRVRPGDHFWSIAESTVAGPATDGSPGAVARYWRRLVAANRSRLVDPDNPDLLLPGQVLVLPDRDVG